MPGTAPVAVAIPSPLLLFDDGDDDDFGDFEFAPAPADSHPRHQDDDQWGDFVASPVGSDPPLTDPFSHAGGGRGWERPRGALPLSMFGDEEAVPDPDPVWMSGFDSPRGKREKKVNGGGDLKDLIANMYGPAVGAASGGNGTVNGAEKEVVYANGNGIEDNMYPILRRDVMVASSPRAVKPVKNKSQVDVTHQYSNINPPSTANLVPTMSGTSSVAVAIPSRRLSDDDDFSDFEFAPTAMSSHRHPHLPDDDEWGDFVTTPIGPPFDSLLTDLFAATVVIGGGPGGEEWERPQGAQPRSLFADDDVEVDPESAPVQNGAGVKKEGSDTEINWVEKEVVLENGNLIEDVDNRNRGCSPEASHQDRAGNATEDLFDVHAHSEHNGSNGFNFDGTVGYEHYRSENNPQTEYVDKGNVLQPSLENGDQSDEDNCWEFKDAFSQVEDATGSPGHQGNKDVWENNLGDLSTPSEINRDKDPGGLSVEHNVTFSGPANVGTETKDLPSGGSVAFSDIFSSLYDKADQIYNVDQAKYSLGDEPRSAELDRNCVVVQDDSEIDEIHWEFQEASVTRVRDQAPALRLDGSVSVELLDKTFMGIYCRLREESLFLIVHHLHDLKVANVTGEQAELMEINDPIQAAYKKIQEAMVSVDAYMGKHPSRDACVSQLLNVMKEPHFQAIELHYCLHDRISSAGKDLKAAIELFEHTNSVLQILRYVTKEEIDAYVNAWSKMAVACSQELQLGARILSEALQSNVLTRILTQGNYFIALGEIYRVSEVLRASLKFYKPWILLSQGNSSKVLCTCLETCEETWRASGMEKALESISSTATLPPYGIVKPLLESIKVIQNLDAISTEIPFGHDEILCNLSLLPTRVLQDMPVVVWNGKQYFAKLANLWANMVSCDPPKLPHIHLS